MNKMNYNQLFFLMILVLSQARRELKKVNSNVYVKEDLSERVREARRHLRPRLDEAWNNNIKAQLKYDKLIMGGEVFIWDVDSNSVKCIRNRRERTNITETGSRNLHTRIE